MKINNSFYERIFNLMLYFLIIFSTLSYTVHPLGGTLLKYVIGIIIILVSILYVRFDKYEWLVGLIIIMVIIPLFLIICGVYDYDISQNINFIFLFIYYLLLVICLSNFYKNSITKFIRVWQYSLSFVLFILLLFYKGISLEVGYLLNLTLSNARYGNDLLVQRYGMGFLNVNTLALFSTILLFCSLYSLYKREHIILSLIDLLGVTVFILNAESRTPFILLIFIFITYLICQIRNLRMRIVFENFLLFLGIIVSVWFMILFTIGTNYYYYGALDDLSSHRISFGTSAFTFLKFDENIWFGLGPLNTTYISETVFGGQLNLDNSIEFYTITIGILGAILIFGYLFYLFYKVNMSTSKIGFITASFYFVYSFFENTIFLPNSMVSVFCLTIIFIILRDSVYDKTTTYNYYDYLQ